MTAFHIHDEDGRITQSNKVYSPDGYDKELASRNWKFVAQEKRSGHADLATEYVFKGELATRPLMPIAINKTIIKVGDLDAAKLRNIPQGARIMIAVGGMQFFNEQIPDTSIDVSVPVPGVYRVTIQRWPFQDWTAEITAS